VSSFVDEAELDEQADDALVASGGIIRPAVSGGPADPIADEPSTELVVPEPPPFVPDVVLSPSDLAIVPPETEMRARVQLAVTLSAAALVPSALRDKPNDVLLVLLTARDLGIKLTTALRLCYPIEGQVTVAPKLKLAIVRERGVARVWPDPANDEHSATWYAVRADDPETTFASTFTWEQAQRVTGKGRLLDQRCSGPGDHEGGGCSCKDNWRNYPGRMLSWRALGYLLDDACGEVAAGLYSPDELGAITDEDGVVVLDVMEASGPLPGTDEPRSMRNARRKAERAAAGDPAETIADERRSRGRSRALADGRRTPDRAPHRQEVEGRSCSRRLALEAGGGRRVGGVGAAVRPG
jgi:hypothetical protein